MDQDKVFDGKPAKEITVELTSVKDVTKDNFDDVVKKVEEMFGPKLQEVYGDMVEASVWLPDMSPEEQRRKQEQDGKEEMVLFFVKVREEV